MKSLLKFAIGVGVGIFACVGIVKSVVKVNQPLGLSGNIATLSYPTTTQAVGSATGSLFIGSILPSVDNQFDLGSPGNQWRNQYIGGNLTVVGAITAGSCTGCGVGGGGAAGDLNALPSPNQTLLAPSTTYGFAIATSTARPSGLFNVDTSGNVNVSGTTQFASSTVYTTSRTLDATQYTIGRTSTAIQLNVPTSATYSFAFAGANAITMTSPGSMNLPSALQVGSSVRFNEDQRISFGSGNSDAFPAVWEVTAATAGSDITHRFKIALANNSNALDILKNGNYALKTNQPIQTNPAVYFWTGSQIAGDLNVFQIEQQTTSTLLQNFAGPLEIDAVSSTNFYSRALPGQQKQNTGLSILPSMNIVSTTGDILFASSTSQGAGPIIKSPDATCYRIIVANGGALTATSVTCPTGN